MKRTPLNGESKSAVFKGGVLYVDEVAEMLNTTPKAIRGKVARRLLPFHKLEGRVIFYRDDLEHMLANLPGCSLEEAQKNLEARKS